MRKPLTVIIVTLSVVCKLKGMSRRSIQRIKAMLLCIVYGMLFVDSVMLFLWRLSILVFVVLTQHCIQSTVRCENSTLLCIKWPLAPTRGKATVDLLCLCLAGLAVHQSEEAAFLTFLELSTTRVFAGKMYNQSPILKLRGCSTTQ